MIAVSAAGIGKRYRRYDAARPRTLQEAVISGFRKIRGGDYFWSLRNVSFAVEGGRVLGVIGRNGAGKSTLLRLLGGINRPDEGQLAVHGRVGGLLELTAGFHSDLSGRENVFVAGVIRGLTRQQVKRRFDAIVDFAELPHAIDRPIRTYSTGMQMRLAFAVAIYAEPEILLVDEVLAVGDAAFQKKCLDRIAKLREMGCTIVMVSHDASLVQRMCSEALWLREGEAAAYGDVRRVVTEYEQSLVNATVERTVIDQEALLTSQGMLLIPGTHRFGSREVAIVDVRITATDGSASEIAHGEGVSVEMDYVVATAVESPIFCITVVDDSGRNRMSISTDQAGIVFADAGSRGHLSARLHSLELDPGTYFIDVGVYEKHWSFAYDYHARAYPLIVRRRHAGSQTAAATAPTPVWVHNPSETSDKKRWQ